MFCQNNLYLQNSTICQEMRLRHDFDNVGRRWLVRSDVRLISYRLLRLLLSWLNVALVAGLIHCVLLLHARGKFAKPTPCFTDLPLNSLRSWNNILGLWRYPHERIRVSSNVRYSDVDTRVCQAYYKLISWRKFIFSVYDLSSWSYKNVSSMTCPATIAIDD